MLDKFGIMYDVCHGGGRPAFVDGSHGVIRETLLRMLDEFGTICNVSI